MIRPLRVRHRHLWVALGIIIPGVFLVSILGRVAVEPMDTIPLSDSEFSDTPSSFEDGDIKVGTNPENSRRITVDAPHYAALADALVYWSPSAEVADGVLLGALVPGRQHVFTLDPIRAEQGGNLLIYSLAHQEVILTHALKFSGSPP